MEINLKPQINVENKIKYSIGRRDLNAENHWIELDDSFKVTKPCVICLGGNGTFEPSDANHYCKMVENLIGLKQRTDNATTQRIKENRKDGKENVDFKETHVYENVDLIGISYGRQTSHKEMLSEKEISNLVETLLLPLCLDKNSRKLPIDTACKNVSMVTFFTHCQGAEELNNITKNFRSRLLNLGYSLQEAHDIISASLHISYASATFDAWQPTIRIDSLEDNTNPIIYKTFKESYAYDKTNGIDINLFKAGKLNDIDVNTKNETIEILTSKLLNKLAPWMDGDELDEHETKFLERNSEWQLISTLSNQSPNANAVSQMMAYAFAVSVNNSIENYFSKNYIKKPEFSHVLRELQGIKSMFSEKDLRVKGRQHELTPRI